MLVSPLLVRQVSQTLSSLFDPFFICDLDLLGYPSTSTTLPLIFDLLNVDCDHSVGGGARCLSHGKARCLGSDFRYGNLLCLAQSYVLPNPKLTVLELPS